jgi:hypothetical protein
MTRTAVSIQVRVLYEQFSIVNTRGEIARGHDMMSECDYKVIGRVLDR